MLWLMHSRKLFGFEFFLNFLNSLFLNLFLYFLTIRLHVLLPTPLPFLQDQSILIFTTILYMTMFKMVLFQLLRYLPQIFLWRLFLSWHFLIIVTFWAFLFLFLLYSISFISVSFLSVSFYSDGGVLDSYAWVRMSSHIMWLHSHYFSSHFALLFSSIVNFIVLTLRMYMLSLLTSLSCN